MNSSRLRFRIRIPSVYSVLLPSFVTILTAMLSNEPRIRGFQRPFSNEQIIAGLGEILFTVLAYIIFSLYARDEYKIITICIYSIPVLMLLVAYTYCSFIDPSTPGGIPCICMRTTQSTTRYCRICRKSIPGLDHHCTWLNTCIGTHNYWAFYILATGGILQYILHIVFCVLTVTLWYEETNRTVGSIVFTSIVALLGLSGVLSFGSLWLFHTHLLFEGIGTYDWLLRRAERTRIRQEEEAKALREKTTVETNKSLMLMNNIPSSSVGNNTMINSARTTPSMATLTTDTDNNNDNGNDGALPVSSLSNERAVRVAEIQQKQPNTVLTNAIEPHNYDIHVDIPSQSTSLTIPHKESLTTVSPNQEDNATDEAYVDDIVYIKEHIEESAEISHRDLRRHLFTAKASTRDENDIDDEEKEEGMDDEKEEETNEENKDADGKRTDETEIVTPPMVDEINNVELLITTTEVIPSVFPEQESDIPIQSEATEVVITDTKSGGVEEGEEKVSE